MVLMTRGKQKKPTMLQKALTAGTPRDQCWIYEGALDKDGYAYAYDQDTKKSGRDRGSCCFARLCQQSLRKPLAPRGSYTTRKCFSICE